MSFPTPLRSPAAACALLVLALVVSACSSGGSGDPEGGASGRVTSQAAPANGACRNLSAADIDESSNDTEVVPCSRTHTAQTVAVGEFPTDVVAQGYDAPALGKHLYSTCESAFLAYLGGDDSAALRSLFSWAWFRPSESAWEDGAHWFRCDLVGGPEGAKSLQTLPTSARGYLAGNPTTSPHQEWTLCARGATFAASTKVPCSTAHDWRAVTTIKLGLPADPYPGDRIAQVRTNEYCSDSVRAYLNYPVLDFDYATTVFGRAEWQTGNRRSVCWARTDK